MASRLLPLIGVIVVAWILVFVGSYIIFNVIVPLPNFFPGREGFIFTGVIKAVFSTILVIIWLLLTVKLTNLYVKKKIIRQ